jgi:hypothetical protein
MEKKNLWETEWKMPLEPRLKILENICQCCTVKESQICTPILYSHGKYMYECVHYGWDKIATQQTH